MLSVVLPQHPHPNRGVNQSPAPALKAR